MWSAVAARSVPILLTGATVAACSLTIENPGERAALGLGRIGSAEARAALERATQDDDPVVRSNVNRALRRGN